MTERQRLQRARMLLDYRVKGSPPATSWRKANSGSKASDKSAAEMCRRELAWLSRWLDEHPEGPMPAAGDWRQEPKRCIGVDGRSCGEEIPRRPKRCPACTAEQRKLDRRGYKRNYHRSHRELENAKRNERRCRQHQRERDEVTRRPYLFFPTTGERVYQNSEGRFE